MSFMKEKMKKLNMNFCNELSSLRKDGSSKIEIGHHITTSISEGDEYSWVYRDKNQKRGKM